MKKTFLVASTLALGVAGLWVACASVPDNHTGQAKPVAVTSLNAAASEPVTAKKTVTKTVAVKVLRVVRDETRFADNALSQYAVSTYDAAGNLVKQENYNQKKQLVLRKLITRAADGSAETETFYNQLNEVQGTAQRNIDPHGRVVQERLLNTRGELLSIAEYTWDALGNPVSWISRSGDRSVVVSTVYKIQDGRVRNIELSDGEGQPITRFEIVLNPQGVPARKVEIDPTGVPRNSIDFGYENGLLVREDYRKGDGSLIRTITYVNDERRVPVQIKYLDRQGRVVEIRILEYQAFDRTETVTMYE